MVDQNNRRQPQEEAVDGAGCIGAFPADIEEEGSDEKDVKQVDGLEIVVFRIAPFPEFVDMIKEDQATQSQHGRIGLRGRCWAVPAQIEEDGNDQNDVEQVDTERIVKDHIDSGSLAVYSSMGILFLGLSGVDGGGGGGGGGCGMREAGRRRRRLSRCLSFSSADDIGRGLYTRCQYSRQSSLASSSVGNCKQPSQFSHP